MDIDINLSECLACGHSINGYDFETNTMMSSKPGKWKFKACTNCSHVNLVNRVPLNDLHEYYDENYLPYRGANAWGKYASFVENDQVKLDQRRVALVQKYTQSNHRVLDVGCGKPTFLKTLSQHHSSKCIGIDFSDHGWSDNATFDELDLRVGEINSLSNTDKVDLVTMWHYLEHDYDPFATLSQVKNLLNNNGYIVI